MVFDFCSITFILLTNSSFGNFMDLNKSRLDLVDCFSFSSWREIYLNLPSDSFMLIYYSIQYHSFGFRFSCYDFSVVYILPQACSWIRAELIKEKYEESYSNDPSKPVAVPYQIGGITLFSWFII